jgi:hypothetical protein
VAEADEVDPEVEPREAEDLPTPEEPVEVELEVALPEVEPPLLRRRPPPLTSTTPTLSLRSLKRRVDRLLVVFSLLPLLFPTLSFPFARHDSRLSPLLFLFDAILQLPSFLFLFLFPSSSCTFVFPLPFRNAAVAALSSVRPFVFSTPFSVPGDVKTRALHEGKSDPMQRANGAHRLVQASPDMLLSRKRNKWTANEDRHDEPMASVLLLSTSTSNSTRLDRSIPRRREMYAYHRTCSSLRRCDPSARAFADRQPPLDLSLLLV